MIRAEFIVRILGTGILYTNGQRDPDLTVSNNSNDEATVYYRNMKITVERYRTATVTNE